MLYVQGPAHGSKCLHSSGTNHGTDFVLGVIPHQFLLSGILLVKVVSLRSLSSKLNFQALSVKTKQSIVLGIQPEGRSTAQLSLLLWACLWSHWANGQGDFVRCTVPSVKLWQGLLKINTLGVLRC